MTNKYLSRGDAPIEEKTWGKLDDIMLQAARSVLAGRRILNIDGPYGLGLKTVALSDPEITSAPVVSPVLPLALIYRGFTMSKRDLAAYEKDGIFLDTKAVAAAAIECAKLEDGLVFNGAKDVPGLLTSKGSSQIKLSSWDEVGTAATDIIKAVTELDNAGYHGPYALALAPYRYNLLLRQYPNGNLNELEHIKTIATEGVVKAPVLENGGVLIASGRQYAVVVIGQDLTVGFTGPVSERLEFSVSSTLVPYIKAPKSICVLKE
jgi:uncharacterized linocin/CFP29 family protein